MPQFKQDLADLVENRIPVSARHRFAGSDELPPFWLDRQHYRLLLSMREDFLPHLDDFQSLIPSLAQNRFRLTAMNGVQALEAVLNPGKEVVTRDVALENPRSFVDLSRQVWRISRGDSTVCESSRHSRASFVTR